MAEIKCKNCGAVTSVGRKFCLKCGAELDIKNLVREGGPGGGRKFLRFVRVLIFLGLLLSLVQMLRAVTPQGRMGTEADADRFAVRLQQLEAGVAHGTPTEEIVSEAELNAYLHRLLLNSPARISEGYLKSEMTDIRAQLLPGTLIVVWTAKYGALPLSYDVVCAPKIAGSRGLSFELSRVRVGHLPLPGRAGAWAAKRLARMFENLKSEHRVVSALTDFSVIEGRARARIQ